MSTWDSSLRSEWHIKVGFVILNELLARKNPYGVGEGMSSETFIAFQKWFAQGVRGILHCVQNDIPICVYCHSERAIPLDCHSERAFGRGRIPTAWVRVWVVKPLSPFKHDSPKECAGFFTAFRMTWQGCFLSFWTSFWASGWVWEVKLFDKEQEIIRVPVAIKTPRFQKRSQPPPYLLRLHRTSLIVLCCGCHHLLLAEYLSLL